MSNIYQSDEPAVSLNVEGDEMTLMIDGRQAMQHWEYELMQRSADILCDDQLLGYKEGSNQSGKRYIEAGLGLGISARRIGDHNSTSEHTVIEKYSRVIDIYHEKLPPLPSTVKVIHDDFFRFVESAPSNYYDGIFFDPALPLPLWDKSAFWDDVVPHFKRILKPGGLLGEILSIGWTRTASTERQVAVVTPKTELPGALNIA